jgi:hypothetical protein
MAILMLFFAGAHGLHGLLNVVEDYISSRRIRMSLRALVLVIWVAISLIGIAVIVTS